MVMDFAVLYKKNVCIDRIGRLHVTSSRTNIAAFKWNYKALFKQVRANYLPITLFS